MSQPTEAQKKEKEAIIFNIISYGSQTAFETLKKDINNEAALLYYVTRVFAEGMLHAAKMDKVFEGVNETLNPVFGMIDMKLSSNMASYEQVCENFKKIVKQIDMDLINQQLGDKTSDLIDGLVNVVATVSKDSATWFERDVLKVSNQKKAKIKII